MLRLDPLARTAHDATAADATFHELDSLSVLKHGLATRTRGGASGSRIDAYHQAYQSGALDPIEATRRVLEAVRRLQPKYVPFAELHEDDVMAQVRCECVVHSVACQRAWPDTAMGSLLLVHVRSTPKEHVLMSIPPTIHASVDSYVPHNTHTHTHTHTRTHALTRTRTRTRTRTHTHTHTPCPATHDT
jgi:hypothetical protein